MSSTSFVNPGKKKKGKILKKATASDGQTSNLNKTKPLVELQRDRMTEKRATLYDQAVLALF